jgi:RNA polymerase sigma-70 factor, ECF subfamily
VQVTDRGLTEARDEELLERIVAGDQDAVAALYDRHSRMLFGLICRVLRDRSEAEDVLQEVFFSVWSKAASYDSAIGVPAAWLVRLTRNRAIDRLRANCVRERTLAATGTPAAGASPEQSALHGEQRTGILRALGCLPDEQRVLIEQAYYAGLTQSELAARFGLPLGTVKTRIRSAIIALRERLATYE